MSGEEAPIRSRPAARVGAVRPNRHRSRRSATMPAADRAPTVVVRALGLSAGFNQCEATRREERERWGGRPGGRGEGGASPHSCGPLMRSLGYPRDSQCGVVQGRGGGASPHSCGPLMRSLGYPQGSQCVVAQDRHGLGAATGGEASPHSCGPLMRSLGYPRGSQCVVVQGLGLGWGMWGGTGLT